MTNAMTLVLNAIFTLYAMVMRVVGVVDGALAAVMTGAGIGPQHQVMLMLVVTAALVLFVLRALGGLLGWLVFLLLILLLMHRIMPTVLTG